MTGVKWLATFVVALLIGAGGGVAVAGQSQQDTGTIRYAQKSGDASLVTTIVVKGMGCYDAEDMTLLTLKAFKPTEAKAVYECSTTAGLGE